MFMFYTDSEYLPVSVEHCDELSLCLSKEKTKKQELSA